MAAHSCFRTLIFLFKQNNDKFILLFILRNNDTCHTSTQKAWSNVGVNPSEQTEKMHNETCASVVCIVQDHNYEKSTDRICRIQGLHACKKGR